ncbi:MAG TPA: flagellar biosynthesis anti-sigma factor FlgM [Edaphobacter sp.]|jgi:flagellar biosynthesis anti-sigma factor FlgM|nr:flagellar biosynthesis anti-sigma factor FlgM [Edaphobacter sp.]
MNPSGINSLQQAIHSIATSEVKPAGQANASDSGSNSSLQAVAQVQHADETNLSSTGGLVAQALESSDTRSAKVASLQQAIAAGNYSVSSADVADKIIQSLLD